MNQPLPPVPRREYTRAILRRKDLDSDPLQQFVRWFQEALQAQSVEPNAMTLATVDERGIPSARIVLLKAADERGFVFCTQYDSRKGRELSANPHACVVFYWPVLERQVRVTGTVSQVSREESDRYFQSRPAESRLAVWVGTQSQVIPNRQVLDERFAQLAQEYPGSDIPLPPYWGGFVLRPETVEFWQGGVHRLHDRFLYHRAQDASWSIERLSP